MSTNTGSTNSGGSKTQQLRDGLTEVTSHFDDAVTALEAAKRTAEEALEHFMMLGGSADRAQSVIELVEDIHREASTLEGQSAEVGTAIDAVDHAITPDENISELENVAERITASREATTAVVEACDDAINQTHQHLAGSSRADDIAGQLEEARDDLDKSRTAMEGLATEARAQQEAFRGND